MVETQDVPGDAVVISAPREIDVATAPALAAQLADALASRRDVVLDCSDVTFCDSTALNVLIIAKRHARAFDVDLHILHPPRSLLRIADILQASDLLGLPAADGA